MPRFSEENRRANRALVDVVAGIAALKGVTSTQLALAWVLGQMPWVVPIPGTTKRHRLEEDVGAVAVELTADDLREIEAAASQVGVQGERYAEAALDRMLAAGTLNGGGPVRYGRDLGYGLGLVVGRYRGLRTVSHSGADYGYRAEYLRFPDQRLSVIVLGNLEPLQPYALDRYRIGDLPIELVFSPAGGGSPRRLTWRDVDDEVYEAVPDLDPAGVRREEYAGTYRSDELGAAFTLGVRGGELVARGWRDEFGPLRPVLADVFSLRPSSLPPAVIRFTRDGRSGVTGFTLSTERCERVRFVKDAR